MQRFQAGCITSANDVESLLFSWGTIRMLSEPAVTGATRHSFGVVELAPGAGHDRHNHPGAEEIIFVLSGEGEQMVNDEAPVRVRAGSCVFIPDGVYHSTLNTGGETLHLAIVYAPAGPERLLREIPGCQVQPPQDKP